MVDNTEKTQHSDTSHLSTGMMVFSMIIWMSFGHKLAHSSKYIGEGMAASLTGLSIGLILLALRETTILSSELAQQLLTFNHTNFFVFFLPPIILYAGLSVRKKAFFKNALTIACMGILGTYVAFAVIAILLFTVSKAVDIKLSDCLALGAIFATTDSVAVLQVLEEDRSPLLFSLVFGEGVINDATTVALLRTVQGLGTEPSMTVGVVMRIFGKFAYLFTISLLMGLAFGLAAALLVKKCNVSTYPQAVGLIGMTAYLSYLVGDYLGLSGIVCLFCSAVTISHYALPNISKQQRAATLSAFETLSFLSEGSIFVYVGLDALDPQKWENTYAGECVALVFFSLLLLLFSRAVFAFPILYAHNHWADQQLSYKEIAIAWWAGGMRGAVSVALVYAYYDPDGTTSDRPRSTLISMTLTVVLISTLIFGAANKPLLDFMLGSKDEHGLEHSPLSAASGDLELTPHGSPIRAQHKKGPSFFEMQPPPHTTIPVSPPSDSGYSTDATDFDVLTEDEGSEVDLHCRDDSLADGTQGWPAEYAPGPLSSLKLSADSVSAMENQPKPSLGTPKRGILVKPRSNREIISLTADSSSLGVEIQGGQLGETSNGLAQHVALARTRSEMPADMLRTSANRVKFLEAADGSPVTLRSLQRASEPGDLTIVLPRGRSRSFTSLSSAAMDAFARMAPPRHTPGMDGGARLESRQQLADWWDSFDSRYMRPVFSRKADPDSPLAHGTQPTIPLLPPPPAGSHQTGARPVPAIMKSVPPFASSQALHRPAHHHSAPHAVVHPAAPRLPAQSVASIVDSKAAPQKSGPAASAQRLKPAQPPAESPVMRQAMQAPPLPERAPAPTKVPLVLPTAAVAVFSQVQRPQPQAPGPRSGTTAVSPLPNARKPDLPPVRRKNPFADLLPKPASAGQAQMHIDSNEQRAANRDNDILPIEMGSQQAAPFRGNSTDDLETMSSISLRSTASLREEAQPGQLETFSSISLRSTGTPTYTSWETFGEDRELSNAQPRKPEAQRQTKPRQVGPWKPVL